MTETRLIVFGSRHWRDREQVFFWLNHALEFLEHAYCAIDTLIVVHGDCPTGADALARVWAHTCRHREEPHPADWGRGKRGGPERNERMAALGARLAVGFWDGRINGSGTHDMTRRLNQHKIPTWLIPPL